MEALQLLLNKLITFLPNVLLALAIILFGWLLAKWLSKGLQKVLASVGIDRIAARLNTIDLVQRSNINIVLSKILAKIVYYFLLLVVIIAATDTLNMPVVSQLVRDAINYVPYLISAFFIFFIGILIADFLRELTLTACQSLNIPAAKFVSGFVFYFLLLNFVMIALEQAGINTDFITDNLSIILAGIVLAFSIGYGFASRALVSNYIASFYSKNRIRIGDRISIDGETGIVIAMDNTTVTLQPDDLGRKVVIPLSKLTTEKIEIFQP